MRLLLSSIPRFASPCKDPRCSCGSVRHAGVLAHSTTAAWPPTVLFAVLSCVLWWRANHQSVRVVRPDRLLLHTRTDQLQSAAVCTARKVDQPAMAPAGVWRNIMDRMHHMHPQKYCKLMYFGRILMKHAEESIIGVFAWCCSMLLQLMAAAASCVLLVRLTRRACCFSNSSNKLSSDTSCRKSSTVFGAGCVRNIPRCQPGTQQQHCLRWMAPTADVSERWAYDKERHVLQPLPHHSLK